MKGLITEKTGWQLIESVFPGLKQSYLNMAKKPTTFLELVWLAESQQKQPVKEEKNENFNIDLS